MIYYYVNIILFFFLFRSLNKSKKQAKLAAKILNFNPLFDDSDDEEDLKEIFEKENKEDGEEEEKENEKEKNHKHYELEEKALKIEENFSSSDENEKKDENKHTDKGKYKKIKKSNQFD